MFNVGFSAFSDAGNKPVNQDCYKVAVPDFSASKRHAAIAVVADGISSSQVSQYASDLAVNQFVHDFPVTSELWSVERAARHVAEAINTRLYVKTQTSAYQDNPEHGYVCTFSAVIMTGSHAVLLHCGDSAIYHVRDNIATCLTTRHRAESDWGEALLSNALGLKPALSAQCVVVDMRPGDSFVLLTDGIAESLSNVQIAHTLTSHAGDGEMTAQTLASLAKQQGCEDNLTAVVVTVGNTSRDNALAYTQDGFLPLAGNVEVGKRIDNWLLVQELSYNERNRVFLAHSKDFATHVVVKFPSTEMGENPAYLDSLAKEEWFARMVRSPYVVTCPFLGSKRTWFYAVSDYIPGQSLRQWHDDNGMMTLPQLRAWGAQLAEGVNALHRKGILHQDIRPDNVLLDTNGILKIIDLGSASYFDYRFSSSPELPVAAGDLQYCAPEYIVGLHPDTRADQYALAITFYFLLSGKFPYGTRVAQVSSISGLRKIRYQSACAQGAVIPVWVDFALQRACHLLPHKRYAALTEFVHDLSYPNPAASEALPLMEKHPLRVWQGVAAITTFGFFAMLVVHFGGW
ncbi:protein kinase domain-containing protein [Alteromonas sp. H39]|uniref:protein kinase domain-containing protein n=1 Tax=Alteromonas sp. H39 TaxID=3389876 RepID=UPI0039E0D52D